MAKKNIKNETTDEDTEPAPTTPSAEDLAFEAELAQRNPGRRITRFSFPPSIDDARAIYLRAMKAKDEVTAAEMADATMTMGERKSFAAAVGAEQRESIRLSVVAIVDVDGTRRFVDEATPFVELDDWTSKALSVLRRFFDELNGVPREELGKCVRGARRIEVVAALPEAPPPAAIETPSAA